MTLCYCSCTGLFGIVLYCIVVFCTVLICIVLYWIILCCSILYCNVFSIYFLLCCTVLYYTVLFCIVLYCFIQYNAKQYRVTQNSYCTVLFCIALYHTVFTVLFQSRDLLDSVYLDAINSLLVSGEYPHLFSNDEMDGLLLVRSLEEQAFSTPNLGTLN